MFDFINEFVILLLGVNEHSDEIALYAHTRVSFIYVIFFFMLTYFNYFIIRYFLIIKDNDKSVFFKKNQVFIDFFINYSVALGVMGTLVSIGAAFSRSDGDIEHTISNYFGPALLTTVVGIVLYGYFFLWQAILSIFQKENFKD